VQGVSRAILFVLSAFTLSAQVPYANIPEEDEVESTGPNFEAAVRAIEKKDWNAAIESLNKAQEKSKDNADIHNLLGYVYRNLRKYEQAFKHYEQAIKLNPRHRSAREYLGEAYLLTNNLEKAQDEFRRLEDLCPRGCQQLDMLKAKIEEFQKKSVSN
jgi:Flp pilus assembly protein TadD